VLYRRLIKSISSFETFDFYYIEERHDRYIRHYDKRRKTKVIVTPLPSSDGRLLYPDSGGGLIRAHKKESPVAYHLIPAELRYTVLL